MNGLDYTLLVIGGLFVLLGIYWGLIRQVLATIGLLVGIAVAGRLGPTVAGWLSSFVESPELAGAIGFIAVVLLVSAAASLVASLLRLFVGLLFLGWLDHLAGGVLGLVQAVLAGAVLLVGMVTFPQPSWDAAIAGSQLAGPLLRVGGLISLLLPAAFRQAVQAALGG